MKSNLTDLEWMKALPKKRMGVAVLIFDKEKRLLVVKQNYKDKWSVPGGVVDENESPAETAKRETMEEIGIELKEVNFLGVVYMAGTKNSTEGIEFIYYGGELSQEEISSIVLQEDEIDAFEFLSIEDALPILRAGLSRRLPVCLEALKTGIPVYFEIDEKIL